jgi:hypothetical protein
MTMSRCDVLIHGATAAAMWVAGLEFPEDARSWPGRTKQSLDMNIVDAGSAGAGCGDATEHRWGNAAFYYLRRARIPNPTAAPQPS